MVQVWFDAGDGGTKIRRLLRRMRTCGLASVIDDDRLTNQPTDDTDRDSNVDADDDREEKFDRRLLDEQLVKYLSHFYSLQNRQSNIKFFISS
jgi:hypothetical protein